MLLGPARQDESLLYFGANLAPPAKIELFLHDPGPPYQGRWNTEAQEQVSWQLGCEHDGGHRHPDYSQQGREPGQGGAIVSLRTMQLRVGRVGSKGC